MYAVKNKTKAKQQQQIVTFPEWVCLTRCSWFMQMDAVFVIQNAGLSKREIWFVQTAKLFFYHSRIEVHILWFFNWLQLWKVRHIMQVLAVKQAGMHSSSVCTAEGNKTNRFTSAGLTGRAGLLWVFHLLSSRGEKLNKLAFISLCRWSLW